MTLSDLVSSHHQTATLFSDDAAELKLSPSAEAQKGMDRVPPGESEPVEGEGAGGGIETNNTLWDTARILLGVPKCFVTYKRPLACRQQSRQTSVAHKLPSYQRSHPY
jgi:hypothetical protein